MSPIHPRELTNLIFLVSISELDQSDWPPPEDTITFNCISQIADADDKCQTPYYCTLICTKQSEKTAQFIRNRFAADFQRINLLSVANIDSALEIFELVLEVASNPLDANQPIYCDCTGGTKTMSVAMALACTHHMLTSDSQTELILTYALYNPSGAPDRQVSFHRYDLLSRVVAEEQDRYIEQQKRMGQMEYLARFSPILAHEIRNPLNLIKADLYLLRLKSGGEYSKELLGEIEKSVNEIDRIINNVQQVVRGETEDLSPPINLIEVVRRLEARTNRRFPALDLQIGSELLGIQLRIPEEKLYTIFTNLIDNAANATQGEGTVTINFECNTDRLLVDIKDNGPGIPYELQPTLFKPMRRGKNASGTGMGLSIVKAFVSDEGGTITYDPNYKEGTRFLIELPIYKTGEARS